MMVMVCSMIRGATISSGGIQLSSANKTLRCVLFVSAAHVRRMCGTCSAFLCLSFVFAHMFVICMCMLCCIFALCFFLVFACFTCYVCCCRFFLCVRVCSIACLLVSHVLSVCLLHWLCAFFLFCMLCLQPVLSRLIFCIVFD